MNDIKYGLGYINPQSFKLPLDEFLKLFSADFLKTINPACSVDESIVELGKLYKKYGIEKTNKKAKEQEN